MGLFIIAIDNQRIRRVLLWILAPLAVLAVWSYFIFAPIPPGEIEALNDVLAIYQSELLASGEQLVTAHQVRMALGQADPTRTELLEQAQRLLEDLRDWVEEHPGAPQADVKAHVKQTWEELGRAMVNGVTKIKSGGPRKLAG